MSRELSCFFCRELFPLYLEEKIDKERKLQIEEHLKTCNACTQLLEKMKESQRVVHSLSETKVSHEMIEYLKKEHYFWSDVSEKFSWKNWHPTLKWGAQLSSLALVLVVTIHFFPWIHLAHKLQNMRPIPQMPMAAQTKTPEVATDDIGRPVDETPDTKVSAKNIPVKNQIIAKNENHRDLEEGTEPIDSDEADENTAGVAAAKIQPPPMFSPVPGAPLVVPLNQPEAPVPKSTVAVGVGVEKVLAPTVAESESTQEQKQAEVNEDEGESTTGASLEASQKFKGLVWRGSLKVDELGDEVAARVTKAIADLGGTKAGQVELGWHRNNQRYYHFILPEENYERLLSVLNQEGIVQLTKERHPRMMKQGYMRIIMTVEESE